MKGIQFLQPWLLLGSLGAAVPILIHLFGRRRARRVAFPSLMLLKETQRRQRSLVRLRHWLVLLLRVLAIIFIALAMARPMARLRASWIPASGDTALAIVMDDSFSMAARAGDGTSFGRAKAAAEAILEAAGPRDAAFVVRSCGDEAERSQRSPGRALATREEALRHIREMAPSQRAAAMPGAMASAEEWLGRQPATSKQLYAISDLQRRAWPPGAIAKHFSRDTDVTIIDVGADGIANHLIESVDVINKPVLVGRPARIRVGVRQYGEGEAERIPVEATVAGVTLPAKSAPATANDVAFVEFTHTFQSGGTKKVTARTVADALPVDDVRYATARVRERIRALCVEAAAGASSPPARFILSALSPGGSDQPVASRAVAAASLSADDLQWADVIILADVPRLSDEQLDALTQRASAGAGVLVFVGERADAQFYTDKLLPAIFGPAAGITVRGRLGDPKEKSNPLIMGDFISSRPPLAPFADASGGDLMSFHFYAVRDVRSSQGPGAPTVLARFDDGTVAMMEAQRGEGRMILVNMAPDGKWDDAHLQPAFVPLLHRLCYYVARTEDAAQHDVLVGDEVEAVSAVGAEVAGPRGSFTARAAFRPEWAGFYEARPEGADGTRLFAANLEPRESGLSRVPGEQLAARLGGARADVLTPDELRERLGRAPRRVELSLLLIILAMAALAGELAISTAARRGADGDLVRSSAGG